jgi:zinc protease
MPKPKHTQSLRGPALLTLALSALAPSAVEAQAARRAPRAAPAQAAPATPNPFDAFFAQSQPRVRRLRNGLQVISVHWPSPGIVAYYTMMRVGSRDEVEAGHSGFAHFFEHMMFRGTEAHPQHAYDAALQALGADNNAFTTSDYTCYTVTGPASALSTFVELEADRFQHLSYSEEVFRTEAGAVRGEYQVWSSNPEQPMWEALSESAFSRHTYRHTTIGYLADVDLMPTRYAYAQQFFRRYYTPDNATIVVVGDFEDARLDALIDQHYAGWQGHRDTPVVPVEPAPTGGRRDLPWAGSSPPRAMIGYRIPAFMREGRTQAATLRDTAALQIIHGLAFEASSPLYQSLVVQQQSLLELGSYAGDFARDPGLFVVSATVAPPGDANAAPTDIFAPTLEAIQAELEGIAGQAGRGHGAPSLERIEAVRSHLLYAVAMMLETPSSVAYFLSGYLAVGGSLDGVRAYFDALQHVTAEDVARVAQQYLTPSHRYVVTLREEAHTPAAVTTGGAQ